VPHGKELLEIHGSLWQMLQLVYPKFDVNIIPTDSSSIWSNPLTYRSLFQQMKDMYGLSDAALAASKTSWIVRNHPFGHYLVSKGGKKLLPKVFPEITWPKQCHSPYPPVTFPEISAPLELPCPRLMTRIPWNIKINPTGCWLTALPVGCRVLWDGVHMYTSSGKKIIP